MSLRWMEGGVGHPFYPFEDSATTHGSNVRISVAAVTEADVELRTHHAGGKFEPGDKSE